MTYQSDSMGWIDDTRLLLGLDLTPEIGEALWQLAFFLADSPVETSPDEMEQYYLSIRVILDAPACIPAGEKSSTLRELLITEAKDKATEKAIAWLYQCAKERKSPRKLWEQKEAERKAKQEAERKAAAAQAAAEKKAREEADKKRLEELSNSLFSGDSKTATSPEPSSAPVSASPATSTPVDESLFDSLLKDFEASEKARPATSSADDRKAKERLQQRSSTHSLHKGGVPKPSKNLSFEQMLAQLKDENADTLAKESAGNAKKSESTAKPDPLDALLTELQGKSTQKKTDKKPPAQSDGDSKDAREKAMDDILKQLDP